MQVDRPDMLESCRQKEGCSDSSESWKKKDDVMEERPKGDSHSGTGDTKETGDIALRTLAKPAAGIHQQTSNDTQQSSCSANCSASSTQSRHSSTISEYSRAALVKSESLKEEILETSFVKSSPGPAASTRERTNGRGSESDSGTLSSKQEQDCSYLPVRETALLIEERPDGDPKRVCDSNDSLERILYMEGTNRS